MVLGEHRTDVNKLDRIEDHSQPTTTPSKGWVGERLILLLPVNQFFSRIFREKTPTKNRNLALLDRK